MSTAMAHAMQMQRNFARSLDRTRRWRRVRRDDATRARFDVDVDVGRVRDDDDDDARRLTRKMRMRAQR